MRLFIETTKSHVHRIIKDGFTQADDREKYRQFYGDGCVYVEDEIPAKKETSVVIEVDVELTPQQLEQWEIFITEYLPTGISSHSDNFLE